MVKKWFKSRFERNSGAYFILAMMARKPLSGMLSVFYGAWLTYKLTGRPMPIRIYFRRHLIRIQIRKAPGAIVKIGGSIIIEPYQGGTSRVYIEIGRFSETIIEGDFILGHGVSIMVSPHARLYLGGKKSSSGSGITCDSRVMVASDVHIGADTIISWGCYITDSNWHEISGRDTVKAVFVGEDVWVGHDVSILQGSRIGDGCVVGAKSLVVNHSYDPRTIIAGVPARVISSDVLWKR